MLGFRALVEVGCGSDIAVSTHVSCTLSYGQDGNKKGQNILSGSE